LWLNERTGRSTARDYHINSAPPESKRIGASFIIFSFSLSWGVRLKIHAEGDLMRGPDTSRPTWRYNSDPANRKQLERFAKHYKGLAPNRKRLVAKAACRPDIELR